MPLNAPSLKQRLATLSLSSSSPTSPITPDSSRPPAGGFTGKRRALFNPSWGRRQHAGPASEEQEAQDRVQDVMTKMIFQAGVDFETRPMVVLNASALPDPKEVSYDLLLSRILSYLHLYVESDYTVVFFAAGGRHTPGWNWIWKSYRSLSRKYRKHLKQLYIVHSSFFSKMLFSLAGAIISPKFFRKISYFNTLSELAFVVPLTQIDIPPAVYQENLKHEDKITLPVHTRSDIFGVPLEDLMGYDGEKGGIPRVVRDCIQFLRDTGLEDEGLFRRSPKSLILKQAQEAYDRGHVVSLETFDDPYLAAVLLKKYIRDLPEPIFPESMYSTIRRCPLPTDNPTDMSSITYIRETLLTELAPCVYILLSHVLHLMHDVSLRSASNRMDAHNLALVLCPNLVSGPNLSRDVTMCTIPGGPSMYPSASSNPANEPKRKTTLGLVIKLCIQRYYEVFDEIRDRTEGVPPVQPVREEGSSETSSTMGGVRIEDEDIDDAMLVMPVGPQNVQNMGAPSAWTPASITYKPRHQNFLPSAGSSSAVRSMHTVSRENGAGNGNTHMSMSKSKSMVSIEKGGLPGTAGRKGSIAIGRGTTRKSSGAGVEAVSITAEGFFSPPNDAPPVPARRKEVVGFDGNS